MKRMDGKVKDFFNEIEAIVPTKETNSEWQECYDERSGFAYYWNVKTDKVTWDVPAGYKQSKTQGAESTLTNVRPRPAPLFPSEAPLPPKCPKMQQDLHKSTAQSKSSFIMDDVGEKRRVLMTSYRSNSSSGEEEKELRTVTIVKAEQPPTRPAPCLPTKDTQETFLPPNSFLSDSDSSSDNEENLDLLTKIQKRAKVLTQLGGTIPASVKKIVEHNGYNESAHEKITRKPRRDVTGFSLVAGYSDSDEEDVEPPPIKKLENKTVVSSALFPIAKSVDVNQFNGIKSDSAPTSEHVDAKAFQRKRRIGIDYVNSITKTKPENIKSDDERLGLGFRCEKENEHDKNETKVNYTGFKSGGLMFYNTDVNSVEQEKNVLVVNSKQIADKNRKYTADDIKKIEDAHKSVSEKLHFLAEGHEAASPVQTMIIQMETLYDAMKDNSLAIDYLYKWLQDTYAELGKLEKGAAPLGWILKWDRMVKRYYYHNQHSGDMQWEYPQPDVVTADDAMDISTTPPPPVIDEPPLPPLPPPLPSVEPTMPGSFSDKPPPPPRIRSPTPPPPPPPTISKEDKPKHKVKGRTKRLRVSCPTEDDYQNLGEPLPPGVDLPQPQILPDAMVSPLINEDILGSAINSFYSDLATLEANAPTVSPPTPTISAPITTVSAPIPAAIPLYMVAPAIQNPVNLNITPEKPIKKKKSKVKLVEGIAMKRKGVSKLVEKWKSVQKDY